MKRLVSPSLGWPRFGVKISPHDFFKTLSLLIFEHELNNQHGDSCGNLV